MLLQPVVHSLHFVMHCSFSHVCKFQTQLTQYIHFNEIHIFLTKIPSFFLIGIMWKEIKIRFLKTSLFCVKRTFMLIWDLFIKRLLSVVDFGLESTFCLFKLVSPLLFCLFSRHSAQQLSDLQPGRLCHCQNSTTGIVEKCCCLLLIFISHSS